jgi:hypothetical protein
MKIFRPAKPAAAALPELTPEERRTIYQQIESLDGEPNFEPTSEMHGAIEEGSQSVCT